MNEFIFMTSDTILITIFIVRDLHCTILFKINPMIRHYIQHIYKIAFTKPNEISKLS